jgi:Fe-S-cluster containining protein
MTQTNEWITGNIVLNIEGEPLEMEMTVPTRPVKPQRMLPVFQQMANSFVDMSVRAVESRGRRISCKAGCGACCRQPVPLSEIEIYQIAELVASMPEPRRSDIIERFEAANAHFESIDWFGRLKACAAKVPTHDRDEVTREFMALALEYFHAGVACPFLENESCSIHQDRPLACREYMVTSPALNCSDPRPDNIDRLELLIKPSEALRSVARTTNFLDLGALTLVRALKYAAEYPERFDEKTGQQWAADFFRLLTRKPIPGEQADTAARG